VCATGQRGGLGVFGWGDGGPGQGGMSDRSAVGPQVATRGGWLPALQRPRCWPQGDAAMQGGCGVATGGCRRNPALTPHRVKGAPMEDISASAPYTRSAQGPVWPAALGVQAGCGKQGWGARPAGRPAPPARSSVHTHICVQARASNWRGHPQLGSAPPAAPATRRLLPACHLTCPPPAAVRSSPLPGAGSLLGRPAPPRPAPPRPAPPRPAPPRPAPPPPRPAPAPAPLHHHSRHHHDTLRLVLAHLRWLSRRVSNERCTRSSASSGLSPYARHSSSAPNVPARPRPPQQCTYSDSPRSTRACISTSSLSACARTRWCWWRWWWGRRQRARRRGRVIARARRGAWLHWTPPPPGACLPPPGPLPPSPPPPHTK
jgi:hypothetical protein